MPSLTNAGNTLGNTHSALLSAPPSKTLIGLDGGSVSVILILVKPLETIVAFDEFLQQRGLHFNAVVIGGAALALLGVVSRQTRDCDILRPELSTPILSAARDFAAMRNDGGDPLADDWLNNGPASLAQILPAGWLDRLQMAYQGTSITLKCLGRLDLLRSKLFALCDRGIDLTDCIALAPTGSELDQVTPWVETQDTNPDWPNHVRATIDNLRQRLGHGI